MSKVCIYEHIRELILLVFGYIADATHKKLSPEVVPTLNLLKKLFESDKQPRRIIQKREM